MATKKKTSKVKLKPSFVLPPFEEISQAYRDIDLPRKRCLALFGEPGKERLRHVAYPTKNRLGADETGYTLNVLYELTRRASLKRVVRTEQDESTLEIRFYQFLMARVDAYAEFLNGFYYVAVKRARAVSGLTAEAACEYLDNALLVHDAAMIEVDLPTAMEVFEHLLGLREYRRSNLVRISKTIRDPILADAHKRIIGPNAPASCDFYQLLLQHLNFSLKKQCGVFEENFQDHFQLQTKEPHEPGSQ